MRPGDRMTRHANNGQTLTVLRGSVSKHHPQVTAAHVLDGNCHLGGKRRRVGGNYGGVGENLQGDTCDAHIRRGGLTLTVSFQHGCFTW